MAIVNKTASLFALVGLVIIAGLVIYTNDQLRAGQTEHSTLLKELLANSNEQNNKITNLKDNCPDCNCGGESQEAPAQEEEVEVETYPEWMSDLTKRAAFFGSLNDKKPEPLDSGPPHDGVSVHGKFEPLASKVDLTKYKRKIFLDLGGRDGDSATWFLNTYPNAKDFEIIVFEADSAFNSNHDGKPWTYYNLAVWLRNETMYLGDAGVGSSLVIPEQKNKKPTQAIDFADYVNRNFAYDDFVVCKMDIEGAEFQVVPKMLSDLSLFKIDELMLECHYYEWTALFPDILRKDCVTIINNLRVLNLYVHEWT